MGMNLRQGWQGKCNFFDRKHHDATLTSYQDEGRFNVWRSSASGS
jgi:hypothetical protein